jgi:5-oxoprolinase (ATP-hydrolysing) subunit B
VTRNVRWAGENGLLIEAADGENVQALAAWLRASEHDLTEVVPGVRTVLAVGDRPVLRELAASVDLAPLSRTVETTGRTVVVDVVYDGADIGDVCARTGLTSDELVRRHSAAEYTVDYFGFSPGLAFFAGVPRELRVPRRASPRTLVPAGSVAIANEYSIVYPGGTPGGWNVLGRAVSAPLWNPASMPPNLVNIGDTIRFRAVNP